MISTRFFFLDLPAMTKFFSYHTIFFLATRIFFLRQEKHYCANKKKSHKGKIVVPSIKLSEARHRAPDLSSSSLMPLTSQRYCRR